MAKPSSFPIRFLPACESSLQVGHIFNTLLFYLVEVQSAQKTWAHFRQSSGFRAMCRQDLQVKYSMSSSYIFLCSSSVPTRHSGMSTISLSSFESLSCFCLNSRKSNLARSSSLTADCEAAPPSPANGFSSIYAGSALSFLGSSSFFSGSAKAEESVTYCEFGSSWATACWSASGCCSDWFMLIVKKLIYFVNYDLH